MISRSLRFAVTAFLLLTPIASAHRLWVVPSTTVLSGTGQHISLEGAISNDLFSPNHLALPIKSASAVSPSGKELEILSPAEGGIRTSFELKLDESGTYRIGLTNDMMFLNWQEGGETKYERGTPEELEKRDPAKLSKPGAERWISRVETIVTCGKPTRLKPTGKGIEFDFVTHPNDLVHGETATFRLLLDGKPCPETEVTIVKGDDRFRDKEETFTVTSDGEGVVMIPWPSPGRYWLGVEKEQAPGQFKGIPMGRGAAYYLTLDVFPE